MKPILGLSILLILFGYMGNMDGVMEFGTLLFAFSLGYEFCYWMNVGGLRP